MMEKRHYIMKLRGNYGQIDHYFYHNCIMRQPGHRHPAQRESPPRADVGIIPMFALERAVPVTAFDTFEEAQAALIILRAAGNSVSGLYQEKQSYERS